MASARTRPWVSDFEAKAKRSCRVGVDEALHSREPTAEASASPRSAKKGSMSGKGPSPTRTKAVIVACKENSDSASRGRAGSSRPRAADVADDEGRRREVDASSGPLARTSVKGSSRRPWVWSRWRRHAADARRWRCSAGRNDGVAKVGVTGGQCDEKVFGPRRCRRGRNECRLPHRVVGEDEGKVAASATRSAASPMRKGWWEWMISGGSRRAWRRGGRDGDADGQIEPLKFWMAGTRRHRARRHGRFRSGATTRTRCPWRRNSSVKASTDRGGTPPTYGRYVFVIIRMFMLSP